MLFYGNFLQQYKMHNKFFYAKLFYCPFSSWSKTIFQQFSISKEMLRKNMKQMDVKLIKYASNFNDFNNMMWKIKFQFIHPFIINEGMLNFKKNWKVTLQKIQDHILLKINGILKDFKAKLWAFISLSNKILKSLVTLSDSHKIIPSQKKIIKYAFAQFTTELNKIIFKVIN